MNILSCKDILDPIDEKMWKVIYEGYGDDIIHEIRWRCGPFGMVLAGKVGMVLHYLKYQSEDS